MWWLWTDEDQRAYEHNRRIVTEHGVTHPRALSQPYTCPLASYGDGYGYIVDHVGAGYGGDQWWPFSGDYVRVAPDVARYSWYCEYVALYHARSAHLMSMSARIPSGRHVATARLTVHFPKSTGGGALYAMAEVALDLRHRAVVVLHDDLTGDQQAQAEAKGHKLLDLVVRERQRRQAGAAAPVVVDDDGEVKPG